MQLSHRVLGYCLLAALTGACAVLWFSQLEHSLSQPVLAQSAPRIGRPTEATRVDFRPEWFDAQGLTPEEAVNIAVYERCNRSVVNISTVSVRADFLFMTAVPEEGSGSGAVIDQAGHILTNYHVIDGARQVNVTLFNEENFSAKLVGADPVNDIAVIKIDAPPEVLFPLQFGDSERLRVGMRVFALGNPFGLERTMSVGTVSSLNRTLEVQRNWVIKSIIQIDASINPGNSGGPLIDSQGRLVGMNTAIASRVAQSAGIGFAIPSNLIQRVVPELIQHGRVIRGDIGITHVTVTDKGLRIARLTPGGPAEVAGLRGPRITRRGPVNFIDRGAADIITGVNGKPVKDAAEFLGLIENMKPGDVVELSILRGTQTLVIPVTLGKDTTDTQRTGQF